MTRSKSYATVLALFFVSSALHASAAASDASETVSNADTQSVLERARAAFRRGAELAKAEHWQEAISSFESSHELKPHPVTSYDIGFCERALRHYTRARKAFKRAFEEERGSEGPLPDDLVVLGKRYLQEMEQSLARVEVNIASPQAGLLVDGQAVEQEAGWAPPAVPTFVAGAGSAGPAHAVPARFLLLIDPGRHTFVFSAPDGSQTLVEKMFAPGERTSIVQSAPSASSPARPADASATPRRTWAPVAFAAGTTGIVAGTIAGALALAKKSTLDKECGPSRKACSSQGDIDAMKTFADISSVGFALGAVGMGVGVSLYLWGPGSNPKSALGPRLGFVSLNPSEARTRARIAFEILPNQVGFAGEF